MYEGFPRRSARPLVVKSVAQVLSLYRTLVADSDGTWWSARACGRQAEDGMWEGWLEFHPIDRDLAPLRTGRETTQPSQDDLAYWASGLEAAYLEGAFERAVDRAKPPPQARTAPPKPAFDRPAPEPAHSSPAPKTVLDPFRVSAQGPEVLARQLDALDGAHLRDVAVAYGFIGEDAGRRTRAQLITAIIEGVRAKTRA